MNTKRFVSGSSVILGGWLAATFLNEVPAQRYPKLEKRTAAAVIQTGDVIFPVIPTLPVTASR